MSHYNPEEYEHYISKFKTILNY